MNLSQLKSKLFLLILLILIPISLSGQSSTTFAFDYPQSDINSVLRFEYQINSSPYVSVGVSAPLNDSLTAPGMDSRQFTINWNTAGSYTVKVRAVFTDNTISADSNSVGYRLIGNPTNLRIKK